MSRTVLPAYAASCLLLALVSCAAGGGAEAESPLFAEVLLSSRYCLPAPDTWTLSVISTPDQLARMMEKCRSHLVGMAPIKVPDIDFSRFKVLSVEMGSRPSSGYGFDTGTVTVREEEGTAIVALNVWTPAPGSVTAQEMTSPCVLLKLPVGSYRQIEVRDRTGRVLARTP